MQNFHQVWLDKHWDWNLNIHLNIYSESMCTKFHLLRFYRHLTEWGPTVFCLNGDLVTLIPVVRWLVQRFMTEFYCRLHPMTISSLQPELRSTIIYFLTNKAYCTKFIGYKHSDLSKPYDDQVRLPSRLWGHQRLRPTAFSLSSKPQGQVKTHPLSNIDLTPETPSFLRPLHEKDTG